MAGRARVVVIGGGVIGCAVLYELARRGIAGVLVEAEPDLCEGTSKANSAIVHTGFDSKPGTIESRMLRRAGALWPELIDALGVPFLEVGALMVARTADDATRLSSEVAANAAALGVETELFDRAAVRDVAPYLAEDVVAALSIPGESVIDPFWLTRAYAEAAVVAGAQLRLGAAVTGLRVGDDEVTVELEDGSSITAEQVVDAAGIRADEVAALADDGTFAISPRKGQFLVSEETFGVDRIVLPIPGPLGKGMLVTPIVFGGLLLGPTAVDGTDKGDRATEPGEADRILASCASMVPALENAVAVRQFAGVRHVSSTGDFIVRPSTASDRIYLAAGIRSTGISTSPAVAETVVDDIVALRGWRAAPSRVLPAPATELPEESGEIVCLCRSIGRGEILAACRAPSAPRTLDAIKRRGGAMFGDCQGNLCALGVAEIVAAERGIDVVDVEKHRRGSWMWRAGRPAAVEPPLETLQPPGLDRTWDVIIVGGGAAGSCAEQ
jgi:glycerol-3-phosphate dehydrogenase